MVRNRDDIRVRPAASGDESALAALVRALVRGEGKPAPAHATAEAIARSAFGAEAAFEALSAELGGRPVGYLAFYHAFSLFTGAPVFLVENLFVEGPARGLGVGRRLLAAAAAEARRRGLSRMEMNVRENSADARCFYERLGVRPAGEVVYRVEDEALAALAATGDGARPP